jgi:guanine deaminase
MSNQIFNNDFMKRAVELSIENVKSGQGGPFGAVIVRNNEIIAEGTNQVTSSFDVTAHAEMVAIRNACSKLKTFDLSDCSLYTSCYPCPMCFGAISWSKLNNNTFYANSREDADNIGFSDLEIYQMIENKKCNLKRVDCEDAIIAFNMWSSSTSKIEY